MSEYNAEKRHYWYMKYRDKILKHQHEYDEAHKEERRIKARNRYRMKCGLKPQK